MTESTQLRPIDQLCQSLSDERFKANLQQALPANVDVQRFVRTAINAIQTHPQQDKLLNCDKRTLFVACQKAAADGLVLDGREATLVAYFNKKKGTNDIGYIPMVQGLVKTARNSGEIANLYAEVVYQNDSFTYSPGVDLEPIFNPDWFSDDRGPAKGAYAVVTLKTGEKVTAILPKSRILKIASGGNNAYQYDPENGAHFSEWWKKTAIKNVLKYAPKSAELIELESHDNDIEFQAMQPEKAVSVGDMLESKPNVVKLPPASEGGSIYIDSPATVETHGTDQVVSPPETSDAPLQQEPEALAPTEEQWPRVVDDQFVDSSGVIFDHNLHGKSGSKPAMNADGTFRKKRNTAAKVAPVATEEPAAAPQHTAANTVAYERLLAGIKAAASTVALEAIDTMPEWGQLNQEKGETATLRGIIEAKRDSFNVPA